MSQPQNTSTNGNYFCILQGMDTTKAYLGDKHKSFVSSAVSTINRPLMVVYKTWHLNKIIIIITIIIIIIIQLP